MNKLHTRALLDCLYMALLIGMLLATYNLSYG